MKRVQRAAEPETAVERHASLERVVSRAVQSPGRQLEVSTRAVMESRFQRDFSAVRVHTDDVAATSAASLHAAAFTVGAHIVFGNGRFDAAGVPGKTLLAHELAHVAQNEGASAPDAPLELSAEGDASERQAESVATAVVRGARLVPPLAPSRRAAVQRAVLPDAPSPAAKARKEYAVSVPLPKPGLRAAESNSINPPPKASASPSLDEALPGRPEGHSRLMDQFVPDPPAAQPPTKTPPPKEAPAPQPVPAPAPAAKEEDEHAGGAVQVGRGVQITPSATDPAVDYLQVTLMLRDFYLVPIARLPSWLKGLGFLGEPSVQLQYHVGGAAPNTLDAQALFNVVQASFEVFKRKLDVSIVGGAMMSDLTHVKAGAEGKAIAPVPGGVDVEYNLVKISPHVKLNLDVQNLFAVPELKPDPLKPGVRKPVDQSSAELRFVVEF